MSNSLHRIYGNVFNMRGISETFRKSGEHVPPPRRVLGRAGVWQVPWEGCAARPEDSFLTTSSKYFQPFQWTAAERPGTPPAKTNTPPSRRIPEE